MLRRDGDSCARSVTSSREKRGHSSVKLGFAVTGAEVGMGVVHAHPLGAKAVGGVQRHTRCVQEVLAVTSPMADAPDTILLKHQWVVRPVHSASERKKHTVTSADQPRGGYVDLSLSQAADRLAIRKLVDAYASCADRRDSAGQMTLFTEDSDYEVYGDIRNLLPTQRFRGRAALAPVFYDLKSYDVTMHFNGQSTLVLDGDRASGVTYCLAHLLKVDGLVRNLMIASIRYLDTFVKNDGVWLINQRKAMVDWTESRSFPAATAG
jgi:hypothetical protein